VICSTPTMHAVIPIQNVYDKFRSLVVSVPICYNNEYIYNVLLVSKSLVPIYYVPKKVKVWDWNVYRRVLI